MNLDLPYKTVTFVLENDGSVIVNHAWLQAEGEAVVAIGVDMSTKRPEVAATAWDETGPGVILGANEGTLHTNRDKSEPTFISFPEYKGWRVFAADVSKYTLHVCLVKEPS